MKHGAKERERGRDRRGKAKKRDILVKQRKKTSTGVRGIPENCPTANGPPKSGELSCSRPFFAVILFAHR